MGKEVGNLLTWVMQHSHLIAILFHCVVDIGVFKGIPPTDKLGQNQAIIPCVGLGETALKDSD